METQCRCTFAVHQHGGRKPVKTSGFCVGSLKTFLVSPQLENIRIDTSLNILVIQNSKLHKANRCFLLRDMFLRSNPDITQCEKNLKFKLLYFRNKACYRAENKPADISLRCLLPDIGKSSEIIIKITPSLQTQTFELFSVAHSNRIINKKQHFLQPPACGHCRDTSFKSHCTHATHEISIVTNNSKMQIIVE